MQERTFVADLSSDRTWGVRAVASFSQGHTPLGSEERDRLRERPGEVVLVLQASDGTFWLHTKSFYPPDVYRLATGGLKAGESPDDGYARELQEETGIAPAPPPKRVARIGYSEDGVQFPFESYLYRIERVDAIPSPADQNEQITAWRKVTRSGLVDVARTLRALPTEWRSWGLFRAVAHEVLIEALDRREG